MLEGQGRLTGANIPQLDGEVTRGGGEDVLSGRVEEDLPDFPEAAISTSDRNVLVIEQASWGYLEWPGSLLTGETSVTSSASVWSVKSCGTSQMNTFPSSEAEAMMWSLKGFLGRSAERSCAAKPQTACETYQSVSRTVAV